MEQTMSMENFMKMETNPLFQLASYNWLVDNSALFSYSNFRILLFIFRKTLGFQKEEDFIRYSQFHKCLRLNPNTISTSIKYLVTNGYIIRLNDKHEVLVNVPRGYRDEIYYRISTGLYQKLIQYYREAWYGDISKTSTYKKNNKKEPITNIYSSRHFKGGENGFRSLNQPEPNKYDS